MTTADHPAGPQRDFVGYADNPPDAHWPNGARVAVQFAINYEEGAEYSILDGSGRTELGLAKVPAGGCRPASATWPSRPCTNMAAGSASGA